MHLRPVAAVLTALLGTSPALAQDLFVYGGAAIEFEMEPNGNGSDNKTDVNAYVEIEKSGFFAGVWAEKSTDETSDKADIYIGYRSETAAGVSYYVDLNRRTYFNDVGDYTVIDVGAGFPIVGNLSGSVDFSHYVDPDPVNDIYVGLSYAVTDRFSVAASYGSYGYAGAADEQEWDFGVDYALGDETSVGVRYYDGTEYADPYFGATLSWDTTFLSR